MSATREELQAQLAELDKKEMGKEAARLTARLYEIQLEASKLIVEVNDQPNADLAAAFLKAANLAEEAAQHGVKLIGLRTD
jgi:hypothetical protein